MSQIVSPTEQQRAGLLALAKRRATGLLVVVTAVFVVSTILMSRDHWLGWVQATAIASLVGGLADWFAVTALFRRPLGLPIPHTAIIAERKDRFAETLGAFVQESFLTPTAVSERLRASRAVGRTAVWLADPVHAADLSGRVADALVSAADLLHDEDVNEVLNAFVREQVDRVALAPLAGRTLSQLTREGRHNPLFDATLRSLSNHLEQHKADLHQRIGVYSPWWLPGPVEDRMVERLLVRGKELLDEMAAHGEHPLRQQLEARLVRFADDLQTSPDLRHRGEDLKGELLTQPQIRAFASSVWADTKDRLRAQAAQPGSALRLRLADTIVQTGIRLRDDPALASSALRSLDTVAATLLGRFSDEMVALVSGTIGRWDALETSRRLELLLGPDLQYIRINGTVVGGLAGLALHAISLAVG